MGIGFCNLDCNSEVYKLKKLHVNASTNKDTYIPKENSHAQKTLMRNQKSQESLHLFILALG